MHFSHLNALMVRVPALVIAGMLSTGVAQAADIQDLPPHTKIRVTVVHWNASSGTYERWDALGGDYDVAADRTVFLPVIGKISVDGVDTTKLSTDIANALQAKVGLVQPPETTVAILAYPPIYVVGDVKSPGEYKFSEGLTTLQAFAMGGGELRAWRVLAMAVSRQSTER